MSCWINKNRKAWQRGILLLWAVVLTVRAVPVWGQSQAVSAGGVDFFIGADFRYRDLFHDKVYEVLLNLTPGVKWNMGSHWQLAGQALVPVYNDYGGRYKKIRLNMAVLSKEWNGHGKHFVKVSGGLFGQERYGLDMKWMCPVASWLAFDAQAGWTGFCSMAADWECSPMDRWTGWAGARIYLNRTDTEMRLHAGRFLYEDYGVIAEGMRHFKHCTVGLYAQYSDKGKRNGGFKVVMMIPPYRRSTRKVRLRPASNFRLTYNLEGDAYAVKRYMTDPEENEREGHFDREHLDWGANRMKPDFSLKEGGCGK